MTHVVKIDIPTGHKEKGNVHFILKIIFHCIFIGKTCIFLKVLQFILKYMYSILPNEILLKYIFLKLWNK